MCIYRLSNSQLLKQLWNSHLNDFTIYDLTNSPLYQPISDGIRVCLHPGLQNKLVFPTCQPMSHLFGDHGDVRRQWYLLCHHASCKITAIIIITTIILTNYFKIFIEGLSLSKFPTAKNASIKKTKKRYGHFFYKEDTRIMFWIIQTQLEKLHFEFCGDVYMGVESILAFSSLICFFP